MRKSGKFSDKLMGRLDKLDSGSLQAYLEDILKDQGFLENVFNTIQEAVIVVDSDQIIRFTNKAAYTLLGIDSEAPGCPIGKYLKQMDWGTVLAGDSDRWWAVSRREVEVFYPEHRFLNFYIMPLGDDASSEQKTISRGLFTLIFSDITEVTEANAQHVETQKVKAITQLAAGVAHELGNPLNSLVIHLQLLKRSLEKCAKNDDASATAMDGKTLQKSLEHVRVAEQEIKRLDAIVKNFLSAVRTAPPKMEPLDIKALLEEAIGFMHAEIENRAIWVEVDIPDAIPLLLGDKDQLMQAAYNIIRNAIQAMPNGGRLQISVSIDDIHVHVTFQDSGCGFNTEQVSRMMEAYFSTKPDGHGLGLLIVDKIVRAHGGELTMEGKPGFGAAFTISLPRYSRMVRQLPGK